MLTQQARQAIQRADIVLSTGRLADGLTSVRADVQTLAFSQLAQRAQDSTGTVAILLSGDTGFYSAAKSLTQKLCGSGTVEVLPGISSIQLFCARFHTAYDDAVLLSLHGRSGALLAPVSYNRKVIMLTGGENKAHVLCQRLADAGLTHITVCIAENLGAETERLVSGTPEQLARETFGDLCVMMTQNDRPTDSSCALRDSDFVRGEVPMTKQEVRWLAASLLSVKPDEIVYDIGAGTGSVTMELARARRARHGLCRGVQAGGRRAAAPQPRTHRLLQHADCTGDGTGRLGTASDTGLRVYRRQPRQHGGDCVRAQAQKSPCPRAHHGDCAGKPA